MQISHKRCFLLGKAGIRLLVKMVWHWTIQEPLICFRSLNARPIVFRRIYLCFPVKIPQFFSAKCFLFSSFTRSNICEIFLPALFLNNIFVSDCKRSQPFTQLAWRGRKYKFDKELEVDTGDQPFHCSFHEEDCDHLTAFYGYEFIANFSIVRWRETVLIHSSFYGHSQICISCEWKFLTFVFCKWHLALSYEYIPWEFF